MEEQGVARLHLEVDPLARVDVLDREETEVDVLPVRVAVAEQGVLDPMLHLLPEGLVVQVLQSQNLHHNNFPGMYQQSQQIPFLRLDLVVIMVEEVVDIVKTMELTFVPVGLVVMVAEAKAVVY